MKVRSLAMAVALLLGGSQAFAQSNPCRDGNPDQSIRGCTAIIEKGGVPLDLADAYYNRGNAWFNKGDIPKAIADYGEAIRVVPGYVNAYFNRGNGYSNLGDLDKAIADYTEVLRLDPDYLFAWFNRGNQQFDKGNFSEALSDYTETILRNPGYAPAYLNRGNTYSRLRQYAPAINDYKEALRLDPSERRARDGLRQAERDLAALPPPLPVAKPRGPAEAASAGEGEPPAEVAAVDRGAEDIAPAAAAPDGEIRVALVIANADYAGVSDLPNPPNDAAAMADALAGAGFRVTRSDNLGREALLDTLNAFADQAAAADWAVVYFAGHGMEMDGVNYLVPVDAALGADRDVPDEAVTLDRVIQSVEGARKLRLVVLDACRNNPFLADMRRTNAARAITRGLARVEPPSGTLVAFAARDGQVALDGDNTANSPFAAALVRRIAEPGLEIGKLFRLVHDDVYRATNRQQEPFTYGALPGEDFFFLR